MAAVSGVAAAWCVYMLRCADGSLYTGITTDPARRVAEHNGAGGSGARYTRSRRPVRLVYVEAAANRAEAARREAAIKQLDRAGKLALCGPGV
ncbi:GIY-YIG nuclease family protein [Thiobacillus denitrificans]|jgi:putative endonuclease|uniref:GIY-YIG nuclease family protein n=1 Tax=Thiobacillus denitrificans TaxID=36861 RepID=UPI00036E7387|nr:GIY-YIG nuclease family protein [Thiobacillus denitrificans]